MTWFEALILGVALVFTGAVFLCLYYLKAQFQAFAEAQKNSEPLQNSLILFSKDIGEIKEASRGIGFLRESLEKSFKEQDVRLKPIDEGMSHLLSYFGTLQKNAGKVGELTFDLLIEQMPKSKVLKNVSFENQTRLEFLIEVGGEWVPVDSKFSKNPKTYFKKAVTDVSSKYLGQNLNGAGSNEGGLDVSTLQSATYGLVFFPSDESLFEVFKDDELRQLMIDKRVWAVSPSNFYWQLFYFRWFETQVERAKDSAQILKSVNMASIEINKSLEALDLFDRQIKQAMANFEKAKKNMRSSLEHFKKET